MHIYWHNNLHVSFNQMWILNRERFPERTLRNADHLYMPAIPAHNNATLKRLPRFNFPSIWNSAGNGSLILFNISFSKLLKAHFCKIFIEHIM